MNVGENINLINGHILLTILMEDQGLNTADSNELFIKPVIAVAHRYEDADQVDIVCAPRTGEGWLEWLVIVRHTENGAPLTLGCIQRRPGAALEVHS